MDCRSSAVFSLAGRLRDQPGGVARPAQGVGGQGGGPGRGEAPVCALSSHVLAGRQGGRLPAHHARHGPKCVEERAAREMRWRGGMIDEVLCEEVGMLTTVCVLQPNLCSQLPVAGARLRGPRQWAAGGGRLGRRFASGCAPDPERDGQGGGWVGGIVGGPRNRWNVRVLVCLCV